MGLTKIFSNLNKNDANIAGGKGASLGEMTQAGIPVPDGFVVLSSTFDHFLHETDLVQEIDSILKTVDHKAVHTIESASEKIRGLIENQEFPEDIGKEIREQFKKLNSEFVAVRSSATAEDGAEHAWAGQLDSFLNTDKNTLLENVKKCWSSLFTPRAIFYRFEKELHGAEISVAVVVQKMIQSEISGIAFSVHPVTQDYNQIIIEAGFGLGEAIVSGSITPDSYVVEKEPRKIIDTTVNTQGRGLFKNPKGGNEWVEIIEQQASSQVLNEKQILELANIIVKIEDHYGFPCDIEWAFQNGIFYIVQSRPITTLTEKKETKQTFIKAYTRNFSIMMEHAWFSANKENIVKMLDLKEYPFNPPYLYFMKDGVEEVWENTKANRWLLDRLIEKLKSDDKFFPELYKRYFERLVEIEKWWKKDIKTISDLEKFIDKVYDGVSDFVIIYGALMDEAVPKEYRELADKFREKDVFFAECNTTIWKALGNIYPELGYLAVYITREELSKKIDKEELKKRDGGFALIPGIFVGSISFNDFVKKFPEYKFEVEKGEHDKNGLRGQIAYKGNVTGKVRIVKRKDQIDQMVEGEIIVSPMTTPDMLPAMQKAIAFVTDEGGITCHAAIIAREMKKPCIIGTKVATQILKDGDEIEVDADNGIIRIINSVVPRPEDYIRMFAGKSFLYLFSELFLNYYKSFGVLSLQDEETWMSFFPKSQQIITLKAGSELYTSEKKYKKYKDAFDKYINSSSLYFKAVLEKNNIESSDIKKFFELVTEHFSHYSKTEFFYTDSIDQNKMIISIEDFDKLKLSGRSYLNQMFFEETGFIKSFTSKISEQVGVDKSDLLNYGISELIDLVTKGIKLSSQQIKDRALFFHSKDLTLFGSESKILTNQFLSIYREISNIIKGSIANKGKVTGRARVLVPDWKDFDKIAIAVKEMKEGEILVAETTSPDIITACKKASAIITNQGGMLSHAAIVSRELGIPCIIGTDKDVILNIKTGDELEVDANNGVIKILNKN